MIQLSFVLIDLTTDTTAARVRPTGLLPQMALELTSLLTLQRRQPRASFRVASSPTDRKPGEIAVNFRDKAPAPADVRSTVLQYPKPVVAPAPRAATKGRVAPPGAPPVVIPDAEIDCSKFTHPLRLLHAVDRAVANAAGWTMGASSLAALAGNLMRARQRRVQQLAKAARAARPKGPTAPVTDDDPSSAPRTHQPH